MSDRKSILVVGIGNPYRCDDGVGPLIAEHLRKHASRKGGCTSNIKDGLSLMNLWEKYDCVYLIDAVSSGRAPGQVYRFDALTDPLPENFFTNYSTHSINIPEIIALAKNLDSLPEELIIYGVEGKDFSIGTELSREVRKASAAVADYIIKDMRIDDVAKSP
jgi:hydrogenase maturation protease